MVLREQWNGIKNMDFSKLRVAVIGDLILDEYIVGDDYRLSDEAPVPVLKVEDFKIRLGGAANVANNIRTLGATPILCGVIGTVRSEFPEMRYGFSAHRFLDLVSQLNMSSEFIIQSNIRTTTKSRILINNQQVARYDYEQHLDVDSQKLLYDRVSGLDFNTIDAIIVSDYRKGVITVELMNLLRSKRIPIIVDPKPGTDVYELYNNVQCITPNRREFFMMADPDDDFARRCSKFIDKYHIKQLIVTMGGSGSYYCDSAVGQMVSGVPKDVVNLIGAGDTFIAAYTLASFYVSSLDAVEFANKSAAVVVSKSYTSTCSINESMEQTTCPYDK